MEVELQYSAATQQDEDERSNSCCKGEGLLLEREASSHGAERLSMVNLSLCCMAHAYCPKKRKAVSIYKTILPARMTVEKRRKVGIQLTLKIS